MYKKSQVSLICKNCRCSYSVKKSRENRSSFCSKKCMNEKVHEWAEKRNSKYLTYSQKIEKAKESFEKHVIRKDGCWGWSGAKDQDGYARMSCSPKLCAERAHVASYIIYKGQIPKGMCILHRCDVRECTNPKCLFAAYPKYNSADMVLKDRQAKGSKNGSSKLNEDQVKEIKVKIDMGIPGAILAKEYNVNNSTISVIKLGKRWKHVPNHP